MTFTNTAMNFYRHFFSLYRESAGDMSVVLNDKVGSKLFVWDFSAIDYFVRVTWIQHKLSSAWPIISAPKESTLNVLFLGINS